MSEGSYSTWVNSCATNGSKRRQSKFIKKTGEMAIRWSSFLQMREKHFFL